MVQRDMDHILTRLDMKYVDRTIKALYRTVTQARGTLTANSIGKGKKGSKKLLNMVQATLGKIQLRTLALNDIFSEQTDMEVSGGKRAIEFLGNVISSITGVPSPREHRQVLEKLRLVNLDKAEMESIIEKASTANKAILQSLHIHAESIAKQAGELTAAKDKLARTISQADQFLETSQFLTLTDLTLQKIDLHLAKAREAINIGRIGKLSTAFIKPSQLRSIVNKIIIRQSNLRPIFEKAAVSRFYSLGSTHVWTDKENLVINSLVQIPIADMTEKQTLAILKPENILHSDLSLAVINERANYYRYLSDSDYMNCIDADQAKICQKRHIEISFKPDYRPDTCEKWAPMAVHDLSDTEILIISPSNVTAQLLCPGVREQVTIPATGISRLGKQCELISQHFRVGKFSFHKHEPASDYRFQVAVQSFDSRAFRPVSQAHIDNLTSTSSAVIKMAVALNDETLMDLNNFKDNTRDRWSTYESESTPASTIILWSLVSVNTALVLLIILAMIILNLRLYKANVMIHSLAATPTQAAKERESDDSISLQRQIDLLASKVVVLENDLLALRESGNPCKEVAIPAEEATEPTIIEEVEEDQEQAQESTE